MEQTGTTNNITQSNHHQPAINAANFDIINLLPAAVYTCDVEGRIIAFNEAAATLWGRRPEIGKDLWCGSWKIFRTDGTPLLLDACPMAVCLREKRPVLGEEIIIERPDGRRLNIYPHPSPIYGPDGKMVAAVNMLVDVTDIKIKERKLKESETKYRLLAESLEAKVVDRTFKLQHSDERYYKMIEEVQDYAIILLDRDGTILNWNRGAETIKGYTEEEAVGMNFRMFYLEKDRKNQVPETLIHKAMTDGKAMHEGWRLRKDGTRFWGYIIITALHDQDNNIIGFSKVTRDLTERKIAEDQLKAYALNIEQQNKQLEEFAFVASHDLQEPLRKIQTFADMLERDIDDRQAVHKHLNKISLAANRMATLIRDVLKYSQLTHAERLFEETDLNVTLANVKEDLDLLITEKSAIVNSPVLPIIKGLPVQLHQLLFNLIGNAIKFNDRMPIIDIGYEYVDGYKLRNMPGVDSSTQYLKLTLKDNGIGFDQMYASQIFKLFKRLSTNDKGTGIGLALCKRIVMNHNGHISASSELNKGTTFTIVLPVE